MRSKNCLRCRSRRDVEVSFWGKAKLASAVGHVLDLGCRHEKRLVLQTPCIVPQTRRQS